jgi:hypothetical protein
MSPATCRPRDHEPPPCRHTRDGTIGLALSPGIGGRRGRRREWIAPRQAAESAPAQGSPADAALSSSPSAPASPRTYAAIAEHPLFFPSRQPWTPPPAIEPKPPPLKAGSSPLANYTLVGVAITNANRVALLKSSTTAKTITLTEGRELDGWTLREINRERLRFESGGATHEIRFPAPKAGSREK